MANVPSEGITIRMAPATLGTVPTAEWQQLQIDKGSLQNWKRTLVTVERDIHDPYMVDRQGDVVGWTVQPQFAHDINKDLIGLVAEPAFRCVGQHPGGKDQRKYHVSAVVDGDSSSDSFTVASNGALPDGVLVKGWGFAEDDNNALFVTSGTSTATAIKVATGSLVAEASPPSNAYVEVVGFECAEDDGEFDADGNFITTTLDLTTIDLKPGMRLVFGGEAAVNRFATAANNCLAYVVSVAAHKITLEGHISDIDTEWSATADDGADKKIQVFVLSLYKNYSILATEYSEKLLYGELEEPKAASGASAFTDCKYLAVNTMTIAAQLRSKVTATLAFVGTDASTPVAAASRTGGAGTNPGDSPAKAYAPLAADLADGHNDLKLIRLYESDSSVLVGQVNAFTLTINNNVTAMECLGTPGAIGHIFGKHTRMVNVQAYYDDSDQTTAASENRKLTFDAFINNGQNALSFRMPQTAIRNDQKTYAANTFVTQTFDAPAFADDSDNVALEMHTGYVPPLAGPQ